MPEQPDHQHHTHDPATDTTNWWSHHRFIVLIIGSIVIAFLFLAISLAMYTSTGTAQLDLSRPGYQSVRDQAKINKEFDSFSATGPVNDSVLGEFEKSYRKQASQTTSVDAFNGEVLSDEALGLDDMPDQLN